jgi:hypothetical protein
MIFLELVKKCLWNDITNIIKNHDHPVAKGLHLHLDPKTLLIAEES